MPKLDENHDQRTLFATSFEPELPPIPGAARTDRVPSSLYVALCSLLAAAGANTIRPPSEDPEPSMRDAIDAIRRAAAAFEVAPGVALSDRLWFGAGPIGTGEVAAALKRGGQGFLLLFGHEVDDHVVYSARAAPFRIIGGIERASCVSGPFLMLVVCRIDPQGCVEAVRGYAQPVLSGRLLVPVGSSFERDVLNALRMLQEKLDPHGVALAIESVLPEVQGAGCTTLWLKLSDDMRRSEQLEVQVSERSILGGATESAFVVTPAERGDGSFIAWLEDRIALPRDSIVSPKS
ncbi:hypothetical protein [Sphingobium sp. B12D2B]|uniref:hypothetical protein n=1 Tax=Sphingobium sp. B12D2B TaxID=2940577 RepID=UPI0022257863|nr:hypothetical protein [Sphingobium sp. B12D2B]MCW2351771.1 hypothetical protein [Sphingobium sp. B12D2B]